MTRRILLTSTVQSVFPGELMAGENEIITVDGRAAAVARTMDVLPDYVVLPSGKESLTIARRIMDSLPPERCPAFLIGIPPQNGSTTAVGKSIPGPTVQIPAIASDDGEIDRISCHGLQLDRPKLQAWIDGGELNLTLMEFSILWALAIKPGHVQTRDNLVSCGRGNRVAVGRRAIDQHIRSLRKKLGAHGDLIETVRGLGYRFRDCEVSQVIGRDAIC